FYSLLFFFSSRRRHTRFSRDWSSDVCSSDLAVFLLSVYWKRTNTMAVNSVLSAGSVLSLGVGALYLWVFPADTYSLWPHYLMLSFYLFAVLFVMGISISLVGSAVVRPSREQVPVAPRRLSHSVRMAWLALWAVMIVLYILFK